MIKALEGDKIPADGEAFSPSTLRILELGRAMRTADTGERVAMEGDDRQQLIARTTLAGLFIRTSLVITRADPFV